jgi:hypothetical protein
VEALQMADCGCSSVPSVCAVTPVTPIPPVLTTDCFVVNSLVCTKEVQKVAEVQFPLTLLPGVQILGGLLSPLVTLTPNLAGIVSNKTIIRNKVINIGFVPATITILGVQTPITVNLPFQAETDCPGACPEDILTETPLQAEAIIIQPVPTSIVGLEIAAFVTFKVILRTTLTVTRPIIAQLPGIVPVQDVNPNRCQIVTNVPTFSPSATQCC